MLSFHFSTKISRTMPIVSRSRSRIDIPTSTQRSRNRAVVISRPLFACFFNVNLGYEIISPELQNFRKNLIDGKHLEILKPFINGSRNGWVRVPCHDVGDVLEDLQIVNVQDRKDSMTIPAFLERISSVLAHQTKSTLSQLVLQ